MAPKLGRLVPSAAFLPQAAVTACFLTLSSFHRPKTLSSIFKASIVNPPLFLDLLPSLCEDACNYIGPTWVFQTHHPISGALITPAMFLSLGEIAYSQVLGIRTRTSPERYYSEAQWGCYENFFLPWRRKWQPTPIFLPGKSHGQRSLVGYNAQGHKESDTTEHAWMRIKYTELTSGPGTW